MLVYPLEAPGAPLGRRAPQFKNPCSKKFCIVLFHSGQMAFDNEY